LGAIGLDRFPRAYEARIDATVILVTLALAFAGLLLASFRHLLAVDPGFTAKEVVTASTSVPASRYHGDAELRMLMSRALDSIRRLPGVAAAGATTSIPFGSNQSNGVILAEGHVMKPSESVISPSQLSVTPGYFETMKIGLVRGRYFDDHDDEKAPAVVIVDEQLAWHFWPGRDPIGRRMYRPRSADDVAAPGPNTPRCQVVGVVRSVRLEDGAYYFPYAQQPSRDCTLAVRAAGEAETVTHAVREAMAKIDPELALFDVKTMNERAVLSLASRRTSLTLAMGSAA
jgi:hypothetical protein